MTQLAYNINQAAEAVGLSRSTIYEAIKAGELQKWKLCGRTVIEASALADWFKTKRQRAA